MISRIIGQMVLLRFHLLGWRVNQDLAFGTLPDLSVAGVVANSLYPGLEEENTCEREAQILDFTQISISGWRCNIGALPRIN